MQVKVSSFYEEQPYDAKKGVSRVHFRRQFRCRVFGCTKGLLFFNISFLLIQSIVDIRVRAAKFIFQSISVGISGLNRFRNSDLVVVNKFYNLFGKMSS